MKVALIASAVALSTIGLLVTPPAAEAGPCKGWGFGGESVIVEPGTGWTVTFFANGTKASGDATASNIRGESKVGTISALVKGNKFNARLTYKNGQGQGYNGTVNDGVASGTTSNGIPNESGKPFTLRLTCIQPG
jgi:hypothetical protein